MATQCPICLETAAVREFDGGERKDVGCEGCGVFIMTVTAEKELASRPGKRSIVSHWVRVASDAGRKPEIDRDALLHIITEQETPTVIEQAHNALMFLGSELINRGDPAGVIELGPLHRRLASHIGAYPGAASGALMYVLRALVEQGLVFPKSLSQYNERVGLTFDGWRRFEELRVQQADSRVAFMAMPFGSQTLNKVFAEFKVGVRQTGFELRRIDENPPAGLIDNRLRVELRRARFTICELTKRNAGAYWEGGFAEGVGRPVIYSCEKAYFAKKKTHFDTNHCHTVLWERGKLGDAVEGLKATIRATLPSEAKLSDD